PPDRHPRRPRPGGGAVPPPRFATRSALPRKRRPRPTPVNPDTLATMRVAMMTGESPPEMSGGAGARVTAPTRFMRRLDGADVDVHCRGAPRDEEGCLVHGVAPDLADASPAIKALSTGLRMADAAAATDIQVVHSHTWYAGLG